MAIPVVVSTYPADSDVGIPVGATLLVYFDTGVDVLTVKDSIVLYGNDSDITSGPDSAIWIDQQTGNNPYYLTSPGFKGVVPVLIELAYYTLGTTTEVDPGLLLTAADELAANVGHVAKITVDPDCSPQLSKDLVYQWHIVGDPDSQDTGISSRTVFDVVADVGNTGLGAVLATGTWTGVTADIIHVKITKDGDIGVAKYKWWYESEGEGAAIPGNITSPRFRSVDEGSKIRFTGSGFIVGDAYEFGLSPIERLATNTVLSFSTNDGTYTTAPASPSTPASSSPPTFALPSNNNIAFAIAEMFPLHASYNVDVNNRIISVVFTDAIDAATITNESVKLWKYPVSGHYEGTYEPVELQKTLTVVGSTLTIEY
jgi:hypothetical protein